MLAVFSERRTRFFFALFGDRSGFCPETCPDITFTLLGHYIVLFYFSGQPSLLVVGYMILSEIKYNQISRKVYNMKNYSLEEVFCEWQKATPEDRAEAIARLRGEGSSVENCSQLDKLYRIKDAAKKLGCHALTVQRYMDSGKLPYVCPAGRRKILESDLIKFMENNVYIPRKERTKKTAIPAQEGTSEVVTA
jgi:excisionase family DNA binding protein